MDTEKKSSLFLFGLFIFIMLVGLLGISLTPKWDEPLANNIYAIAGLFAFSGDWTQDLHKHQHMNLFIEFARFAAPLTTALIFFVLIFDGAKQLIAHMLRPRNGFELIIGLGNKGSAIAVSALEQGKKVIAIELQSQNSNIAMLKKRGAIVFNGQINAKVVKKINVSGAKNIFFCCGDDNKNIATAEQVLPLLKQTNSTCTPHIFVHLHSRILAEQLKQLPRFINNTQTELHFWRKSHVLAEHLLQQYPLARYANIQGVSRANVIIFGCNDNALDLARTMAKSAIYKTLKAPIITMVTGQQNAALQVELTAISAATELHLIDESALELINQPHRLLPLMTNATQVFIFEHEEINSFSVALALRNIMLKNSLFMAPIIYATDHNEVRGSPNPHTQEIPDNLFAFNNNSKDINISSITQPQGSLLAKRTHEHSYVVGNKAPAQCTSWQELPYSLKEANREFALSWHNKLAAVGVQFCSANHNVQLSSDELNLMSAMEHTRWCAERRIDGWQFNNVRSNLIKQHPLLKPWDELNAQQKQGNNEFFTNTVNDLQAMAKNREFEFGLQRVRTIAVTGHRFNALSPAQHSKLVKEIDNTLLKIKLRYPHDHIQLVSGLAQGADRLVVERARIILNAPFIALLPMTYELYKTDFENDNNEFEQYIYRALWYSEIPPIYQHVADMEADTQSARARQYASLGAHLVTFADDLIAIWDGKESRGLGGTADVVDWWQNKVPEAFAVKYPLKSVIDKGEAYIINFARDE
ncbi:RyR domain-containing protein [Pseudoalteromonas sp. H105]|uniref:RyR domain-containing protein n=1 Tax=Pseudoalteromonas sp. H105 TaxID=1348393 RepID=UPI0007321786|nr:RyR domain-containing protein [Pseudoalteromonas sp. H105]KTF13406.1 hypothetical protein ATS75_14810 [Pseudoalteromonas sp. H105]